SKKASTREDCNPGSSQIAQDINNVRARLLINGDAWWDGRDAKYVVPKVEPGFLEVSSVFAGAVWIGGLDEGDNLRLAAKTYGASPNSGRTDYWPGPINEETGFTDSELCEKWDKHFEVLGEEILLHLTRWQQALTDGVPYEEQDIPEAIRGWPAKGNDFFFDVHNFNLPITDQGLAGYFDQDENDKYEPDQGDYPFIEIRGCEENPQFPDEMIFWIYNDIGNTHTQSTDSEPMKMEVQVQSFAYATNDEINDMTFQRFKLINRGTEDLDSTFFAMWVDPDLGCAFDDYTGCDIDRSFAYIYNSDAFDGIADQSIDCAGTPTYGTEIPMLGIDYFRGPLDEFGQQIGMSSFTYYNNGGANPPPPPGTDDPNTAQEYYNYLSGSWRDGTRFTQGGDGYNPMSEEIVNYAFPDPPAVADGWSMAEEELPNGDRRTIQASGPFTLKEDTKNELIVGVVWVPNVANHPTPDISRLLFADDLAQSLFDNCFQITDGPDAPDLDWLELDQELVVLLTNDTIPPNSNNPYESYEEIDLQAPGTVEDNTYKFEGYKIFQMRGPNDTDISDVDRARLVVQVDIRNDVAEIYNWTPEANPLAPGDQLFLPELRVEGADEGIRHSFKLTNDAFTNQALINHKRYYYRAIAYAYNNYADFNADTEIGQRRPYLEGRRNIQTYTVIPRPVVDRKLNSSFGQGAVITRLDGEGLGNNFIDVTDESRDAIFDGSFGGSITYEEGRGPIDVRIFNPLEVRNGTYQLRFVDEDLSNDRLDSDVRWELVDESGQVTKSETNIDVLNEQLIADYGFSVNIAQTPETGTVANAENGAIGIELEYADPNGTQWYNNIQDTEFGPLNYIKTEGSSTASVFDPNSSLSRMGNGELVPFFLCDWTVDGATPYYVSPAWDANGFFNGGVRAETDSLRDLNNVDIIFTSDKSKWSRCVVVETANQFYTSGTGLQTEGNAESFELRSALSVGRDAGADGLPAADGDVDENGEPLTGMGWFPGYAIDVETGQRLNIFFGENSVYDCDAQEPGTVCDDAIFQLGQTGRDMMWNPTPEVGIVTPGRNVVDQFNLYLGGQHFIYVTSEPYDSCNNIRRQLVNTGNIFDQILAKKDIRWAGIPVLQAETELLSYGDGLIPNDLTIKVRVDNPYRVNVGTGQNNGYPTYEIKFEDVASDEIVAQNEVDSVLDLINLVPNPYYGFSDYENSQFSNIIKITNLPAVATVTIYTLDGKFIRQYLRDETGLVPQGNNRALLRNQILPDIEWDLKNSKGIAVASGVYLVHVDAPGLGERTLKWFGIA
ncbi:MAG: hypothetical protein AAF985_18990, partial [Bacteroidota bacterium]